MTYRGGDSWREEVCLTVLRMMRVIMFRLKLTICKTPRTGISKTSKLYHIDQLYMTYYSFYAHSVYIVLGYLRKLTSAWAYFENWDQGTSLQLNVMNNKPVKKRLNLPGEPLLGMAGAAFFEALGLALLSDWQYLAHAFIVLWGYDMKAIRKLAHLGMHLT